MLGRTERRIRDRIYCQTMRTVRDISRDNRARIATCSWRTLTDRLKANYSIDKYWRYVNATNNNALYTQGLIFTAHTNTSTLFAPNSPSPSVTTHLPIHLITPGNMPTFQSQSPISPRPAHIECHTNNLASSCSHLTYSVPNLFTSLHVYHTPPRLLNILIFKVRSDPGIASPGRFAWA